MKRATLFVLLAALLFLQSHPVQADSSPSCTFQPDGSIECSTGGGGSTGGGDGGEGGNTGGSTCDPTTVHYGYQLISFDPATNTCTILAGYFTCSGEMTEGGEETEGVPCSPATSSKNPCDKLSVSAAGITCESFEWNVRARVSFPEIYLDVRPYPATLVRWPTAVRDGGLLVSSGSGGVNYVPNGGGSLNNPKVGDWRDLKLTLTLRSAGPMFVSLPNIGDLVLPDQGATGNPTMIKWEVSSHPAVGAGPLAGSISGLNELPGDIPLFVGKGRAPYKLYWDLRYYEYEAIQGWVAGPKGNGGYNCGGGTGHKAVVGYKWKQHSDGGEIPPSVVQNLPASVMADINNDGVPDAYWDNNLTLRRMDDNNRVDNPRYQRSWNWGGIIYWAVREGQGQIGWPD